MPEFDSTTEYRPIPNFPGYMAGSDGSIWSNRAKGMAARYVLTTSRWRKLKPSFCQGYDHYTLVVDRVKLNCLAHILVLTTFVGPPSDGQECRHLDGNRGNNRLDNLAWGTRLENNQDKIAHGKSLPGEQCNKSKLTNVQVLLIRKLASEGHSGISLARKFNVSNNSICRIIRRETWRHLPSITTA